MKSTINPKILALLGFLAVVTACLAIVVFRLYPTRERYLYTLEVEHCSTGLLKTVYYVGTVANEQFTIENTGAVPELKTAIWKDHVVVTNACSFKVLGRKKIPPGEKIDYRQ
jgi:hypothetical protein